MAYSYVNYTGDGSKVGPFSVPFPYISKEHVHVYQMGTEVGFTWLSPATIELNVAPALNDIIHVCRLTARDARLVSFQNGSLLNADTQNLDSTQLFYLYQEAMDLLVKAGDVDNAIFQDRQSVLDALIGNLDRSMLTNDLLTKIDYADNWEQVDNIIEQSDFYVEDVYVTPPVVQAVSHIAQMDDSITQLISDTAGNASEVALLIDEYHVKIDANGNVAGFGLYNDGDVSEFVVAADKFGIVKPDGSGGVYVPFIVDAVSGLVGIDGSLVVTGSISASQIAADAVTAEKIYAGAVTADSIAADAINGDHIAADSEIVLSEGGLATFGDSNVLIETEDIAGSEGRIIVAPNGGPTGQNYTVIESGDITQYIWDGAAHRSYSPVTSGTGTANGSTAINIPGYWKKAPVVTVSPNTIQAYHPSYPSTAQTIQCNPGNVSLQSGSSLKYKFTPSISLSISSGSAWRALSVTDAHGGGALAIAKTGTTRAVATPYTGVRQVTVSFNSSGCGRVNSLSGAIWLYMIPTLQVYRAGAWVTGATGAQQNSLNTTMYWTLTSSVQASDIQYYRVNWWLGPQNGWSGYYLYNGTTQGINVNYTAETKYITGTTLASSGVVNWIAVGQD